MFDATQFKRTLAALMPGSTARTAKAKRDMERKLRAGGMSRTEAMRTVALHFKSKQP